MKKIIKDENNPQKALNLFFSQPVSGFIERNSMGLSKNAPVLLLKYEDAPEATNIVKQRIYEIVKEMGLYEPKFSLLFCTILPGYTPTYKSLGRALNIDGLSIDAIYVHLAKAHARLELQYKTPLTGSIYCRALPILDEGRQDTARKDFKAMSASMRQDNTFANTRILRAITSDQNIGAKMANKDQYIGDKFTYKLIKEKIPEKIERDLCKISPSLTSKRVNMWAIGASSAGTDYDIVYFIDFIGTNELLTRVFWTDVPDMSYVTFAKDGTVNYADVVDCRPKFIEKDKGYKKKPHSFEQNKYMTWDFETWADESGKAIPYAIGLRYGVENPAVKSEPSSTVKIFYLADYAGGSVDERASAMVGDFLAYIVQPRFTGYRIFAHNFSRFDGPILLAFINYDIYKVTPVYANGNLYQLSISGAPSKIKCKVYMRCSALLIPGSLDKLAKGFGVTTKKGTFPHEFACNANLLYKGMSPCGQKTDWNFRTELESYLTDDVNALFEVVHEFRSVFARHLSVDVMGSLTASSLAFKTYTEKYMKCGKIPMLRGQCETAIRSTYRGGVAAIYKPKIENGYYYDVNSMYPATMLEDMPVGAPRYIIKPNLDTFYGFCKAEIVCPDGVYIPFLSFTDPITGSMIVPTGSWTGWYFSEELKYAVSLGYKIRPISGYKFERGVDVFTDYVTDVYEMKKTATDPSVRLIMKLLLNGLYGKFGVKTRSTETHILDQKAFDEIIVENDVVSYTELANNNFLVEYSTVKSEDRCITDKLYFASVDRANHKNNRIKSSVGIASAITAYARIKAHKIKMLDPVNLYYSDTDSFVFKNKLDARYVGSDLGELKLEHVVTKGIFAAEKCYKLETPTKTVMKFKGVPKSAIQEEFYECLYRGEAVEVDVFRFFTSIKSVCTKDVLLKIAPYAGIKRSKVYNDGLWVDTKPRHMVDGILDDIDWQSTATEPP